MPYYSYGIQSVEIDKQQRFLIASPIKALFDKIITTAGVNFRSRTSVLTYLEDDLRIDIDVLRKLDLAGIETWIPASPKKESLTLLIETIRRT